MTRPAFRPAFYPAFRPAFNKLKSVAAAVRSVYNFDGIDDRGQLAFKAIDPDGDIDIEFKTGATLPPAGASWTIVSQNITTTSANREFGLYTNNLNALQLLLGGAFSGNMGQPLEANRTYRITLVGTALTYFKDGVVTLSTTFNRGGAREPSALTGIAARNTAVASYGSYYAGNIYDLKINGTLWPISDNNQTIQLPSPSGLGFELITQSVLESPNIKGSQWTYLGEGRWRYIGDGSFNELNFITPSAQPAQGYLEFEIESITGTISCVQASGAIVRGSFNTIGVKRYFFTDKNEGSTNGATITFKRPANGVVTSCIIKNISFKPLGTCNPLTLVNTTPDRWQEVPL